MAFEASLFRNGLGYSQVGMDGLGYLETIEMNIKLPDSPINIHITTMFELLLNAVKELQMANTALEQRVTELEEQARKKNDPAQLT